MTQIPEIVTYHSTNNKPEWFAYCKPQGEFLGVRFEGSTEEEAITRAKNWWLKETERQARLVGKVELESDEVSSKTYKNDGFSSSWGNSTSDAKSDHGLTGSVWVGNPTTKEKKRVSAAEADTMLASGWIKAGPRTQL